MLDKDSAEKRLNELKDQLEKFRETKWLYIRNEKGELVLMTLNDGEVKESIIKELETGIKVIGELLAAD